MVYNGDLDPSVLLCPAMVLTSTNEWETDLLKLQFKAMDDYREYMSKDEDTKDDTDSDNEVRLIEFSGLPDILLLHPLTIFSASALHYYTTFLLVRLSGITKAMRITYMDLSHLFRCAPGIRVVIFRFWILGG